MSVRSLSSGLVILVAAAIGGCAGNAPILPPPGLTAGADLGAAPARDAGSAQGPAVSQAAGGVVAGVSVAPVPRPTVGDASPCKACTIVGFRQPIVTLYLSETGQEAQRVPKAALPLPMVSAKPTASSVRLQIMTLDGVRWVSQSDVDVVAGS